jgi:hypothetical protein
VFQRHRARVGLRERPQLGLEWLKSGVEEVDQRQTFADRAAPDIGYTGALEQRQPVSASQAL